MWIWWEIIELSPLIHFKTCDQNWPIGFDLFWWSSDVIFSKNCIVSILSIWAWKNIWHVLGGYWRSVIHLQWVIVLKRRTMSLKLFQHKLNDNVADEQHALPRILRNANNHLRSQALWINASWTGFVKFTRPAWIYVEMNWSYDYWMSDEKMFLKCVSLDHIRPCLCSRESEWSSEIRQRKRDNRCVLSPELLSHSSSNALSLISHIFQESK